MQKRCLNHSKKIQQKAFFLIFFFLFIFIGFGLFFLNSPEKQAKTILSTCSPQVRNEIHVLCEYFLRETEFGYTLFGDKPVSLLSLEAPLSALRSWPSEKRKILFYKSLSYLKEIAPSIRMRKYALSYTQDREFSTVYLVNLDAFKDVVLNNREIFEQVHGKPCTPEILLEKFRKNGDFFKSVCRENRGLLGICLGYGTRNSLNFLRREKIERYFLDNGLFPWKHVETPFLETAQDFLEFQMNKNVQCSSSVDDQNLISPSFPFSSLHEELEHVEELLQPTVQHEIESLTFVPLPCFMVDRTSQETIQLLKKYESQQKQIQKILSSKNLPEKILGKLIE